jgi:hypothetical protein
MSGFAAQRTPRVENLGPFAFRAADVACEMGSVVQLLRIIKVRGTPTLAAGELARTDLGRRVPLRTSISKATKMQTRALTSNKHHCRNLPTRLAPMHQITNLKPLHF